MNQELETFLKTLLKNLTIPSATQSSKCGRLLDTLNSPFFVTLVGGIILAVISGTLTQCNAINSNNREIALEELHQKQRFIDSFCTNIEQYLTLTLSVRKREIFLNIWQAEPGREAIRYPDGRTFDQTRIQWELEKRYWIEHSPGSALGLIYTGKLLFPNPATSVKLDNIAKSVDDYGRAKNFKDLQIAYDQVLDRLEEVTSLMAKELYEK